MFRLKIIAAERNACRADVPDPHTSTHTHAHKCTHGPDGWVWKEHPSPCNTEGLGTQKLLVTRFDTGRGRNRNQIFRLQTSFFLWVGHFPWFSSPEPQPELTQTFPENSGDGEVVCSLGHLWKAKEQSYQRLYRLVPEKRELNRSIQISFDKIIWKLKVVDFISAYLSWVLANVLWFKIYSKEDFI